jgi:hypothetical protein
LARQKQPGGSVGVYGRDMISSSSPITDEATAAGGDGPDSDRSTVAPPFDLQAFAQGSRDAAEGSESDRPTVLPPFDLEAFARDSEIRQRIALPAVGETTIAKARWLFQAGDSEQALFLVERLLEQIPLDTEARALSNECRAALEAECLSMLGSHATILIVAVSPDALKTLALDHVSGFLLTLTDGLTDLETLLDLCGLPRLLALRHLQDLVTRGIVVAKGRASSM